MKLFLSLLLKACFTASTLPLIAGDTMERHMCLRNNWKRANPQRQQQSFSQWLIWSLSGPLVSTLSNWEQLSNRLWRRMTKDFYQSTKSKNQKEKGKSCFLLSLGCSWSHKWMASGVSSGSSTGNSLSDILIVLCEPAATVLPGSLP